MIIDYLKDHKTIFMASLTALCVAMMLISATAQHGAGFLRRSVGFVFAPVMTAFSNTGGWIAGRAGSIVNVASLEAENARLIAENEDLLLRMGLLETQVTYFAEIEELLGISQTIFRDLPTMGVYIIARDQACGLERQKLVQAETRVL